MPGPWSRTLNQTKDLAGSSDNVIVAPGGE
jgi:hypothetical protein